MKLTRKAHAKLNLFLEVTGVRADGEHKGYHELYSCVVFLDLADEVTVESALAISVAENNYNSNIAENIIHKTATRMAEKYAVKSGAKITFTKNIPIGGGLGGGSADAAATIVLLNKLWDLKLKPEQMYELALEMGADVPVCLYSILKNKSAAIFKGIGEEIAVAPKLPKMFFTLANPGAQLATKDVFKNFKYEGLGYEPLRTRGNFITNIGQRSNDLEPAAIELAPEIETALKELGEAENCKLARMTGSGATSFGLFKNKKDARAAAVALIKNHPSWQVGPVGLKTISRYSRWQKLRRSFVHSEVHFLRGLRDSKFNRELSSIFAILHIKIRWGRALTFSLAAHLLVLLIYDTSFTGKQILSEPEFINVAFAIEDAPPPPPESKIETAAGDEEPEIVEEKKPVEKSTPVMKKAAVPAAKPVVKKLGKKPGLLNTSSKPKGNSIVAAKKDVKDYLELLQYTVQERSQVHSADPSLRGKALLELVFNRQGYVLTYKLKKKTGEKALDNAAEKLAKNLMENPLPAVPDDFERGEEILQYDFLVSYPPAGRKVI